MTQHAIQTLYEFLEENPAYVSSSATIYLPRARMHPFLAALGKKATLHLEQSWYPFYHEFVRAGLQPAGEFLPIEKLQALPLDCAIVIPTKQKVESLYLLGRAIAALKEGGTLIFCAENTRGAKSYKDQIKKVFGEYESHSRAHCGIYTAVKKGEALNSELLAALLDEGKKVSIPYKNGKSTTEFSSYPGVYGWNSIDEGSELLASKLPKVLTGKGIEFGSGYGFLAAALLERCEEVNEFTLLEAEQLALSCCKENLAKNESTHKAKLTYVWGDVLTYTTADQYDFVISNPPIHDYDDLNRTLAESFVQKAATCLRAGGSLYMVVQATVACEKMLSKTFSHFEIIGKTNKFKLFRALKASMEKVERRRGNDLMDF